MNGGKADFGALRIEQSLRARFMDFLCCGEFELRARVPEAFSYVLSQSHQKH
jgi:hypothetical protein